MELTPRKFPRLVLLMRRKLLYWHQHHSHASDGRTAIRRWTTWERNKRPRAFFPPRKNDLPLKLMLIFEPWFRGEATTTRKRQTKTLRKAQEEARKSLFTKSSSAPSKLYSGILLPISLLLSLCFRIRDLSAVTSTRKQKRNFFFVNGSRLKSFWSLRGWLQKCVMLECRWIVMFIISRSHD